MLRFSVFLLILTLLACAPTRELNPVIQQRLMARPDLTAIVQEVCDTQRDDSVRRFPWQDERQIERSHEHCVYDNSVRANAYVSMDSEILQSCFEEERLQNDRRAELGILLFPDVFSSISACEDRKFVERQTEGMHPCERRAYLAGRTQTGRLNPSYSQIEFETCLAEEELRRAEEALRREEERLRSLGF